MSCLIPIHPALARALQAGPVVGMKHIITDARGKPLRRLTELIEAAVKTAGLPPRCVAHGLRKAALRRLGGSTVDDERNRGGKRTPLACRRLRGTPRGRTRRASPEPRFPNCRSQEWNDLLTNPG